MDALGWLEREAYADDAPLWLFDAYTGLVVEASESVKVAEELM